MIIGLFCFFSHIIFRSPDQNVVISNITNGTSYNFKKRAIYTSCACDISNYCDPYCCCDPDCSQEIMKEFDFCLPETTGEKNSLVHCNSSSNETTAGSFSEWFERTMLCIYRDRNLVKGDFYETPGNSSIAVDHRADYYTHSLLYPLSPVKSNENSIKAYDDVIITNINTSTLPKQLDQIPRANSEGFCRMTNIHFLENIDEYCMYDGLVSNIYDYYNIEIIDHSSYSGIFNVSQSNPSLNTLIPIKVAWNILNSNYERKDEGYKFGDIIEGIILNGNITISFGNQVEYTTFSSEVNFSDDIITTVYDGIGSNNEIKVQKENIENFSWSENFSSVIRSLDIYYKTQGDILSPRHYITSIKMNVKGQNFIDQVETIEPIIYISDHTKIQVRNVVRFYELPNNINTKNIGQNEGNTTWTPF